MTVRMDVRRVESVEELIDQVRKDYENWKTSTFPWFRGEAAYPKYYYSKDGHSELVPTLYRYKFGDRYENRLLQQFRMKAPIYDPINTPQRNETDQWLFLARHVGLPIRLLDWTEGLLVALHWALQSKGRGAAVWMLNPIALNELNDDNSLMKIEKSTHRIPVLHENTYPLTWFSPELLPFRRIDVFGLNELLSEEEEESKLGPFSLFNKEFVDGRRKLEEEKRRAQYLALLNTMGFNKGNINIRAAWETDHFGTEYPIAIHPTNINPRMSSQKSTFTIHGARKEGLAELLQPLELDPQILYKYRVGNADIERRTNRDLRMIGITHAAMVPDLDGLARDLREAYLPRRQ